MKRKYNLRQQCIAYLLLVSLFLQSCTNSFIPNISEREEEWPHKQITIREAIQEQEDSAASNLPLGKLAITSLALQEKPLEKKESEQAIGLGNLNLFPREILQIILSYIQADEIGKLREVNKTFYRLTTGYNQPGLVGVEHKPHYNIYGDRWMLNKVIDFQEKKLKELTPENILSFLFFHLLTHLT